MESILADRIVSLSWRLKRADLIQNQTIDAMHEESTAKPFPALARLLTPENQDPDLILGRIALKDFSNERVLDRLLMYERRIEHSLYKTILELQRLRLLRTLEHPNAADPATPNPPNCNPAHAGIPIHQDPISHIRPGGINIADPPVIGRNQSSIVNMESTPEPPQNHPTSTIKACPPKAESSIIAQNKPNSLKAKTNATSYATKIYPNIPLRTAPKKQTQTKPTPPTQYAAKAPCGAIPNTQYEKQTQTQTQNSHRRDKILP